MTNAQNALWHDLGYHLELSSRLFAAGENDEAASETTLALALFATHFGPEIEGPWSDLPVRVTRPVSEETAGATRRRAHALALEIQAHYVSEGRHQLAEAYATAATWLLAA